MFKSIKNRVTRPQAMRYAHHYARKIVKAGAMTYKNALAYCLREIYKIVRASEKISVCVHNVKLANGVQQTGDFVKVMLTKNEFYKNAIALLSSGELNKAQGYNVTQINFEYNGRVHDLTADQFKTFLWEM